MVRIIRRCYIYGKDYQAEEERNQGFYSIQLRQNDHLVTIQLRLANRRFVWEAGLPDFSCYNLPKRIKHTKLP
jgi:hypothetical protein